MANTAAHVSLDNVSSSSSAPAAGKLTLIPLVALVVGSMIGGGVFNLAKRHVARGLAGSRS